MKKTLKLITGLFIVLGLSSCGINHAYVFNHNQNQTQVKLAEANFKMLEKVSGTAAINYVMLIGGSSRTELYQEAYRQMVEKANLEGSAKTLTNITTEEHLGGFPPFYFKRTITVHAQVVEFK
tara:strand:- start:1877 stop:2245 length:369 start_codon:yes stop_codon:yes gene_type:complete